MPKSLALLQGTVDVLVLRALDRRSLHGYGVADWIRDVTDGALQVEDGALYAALHRMERKGWLTADWAVSPKGRRAKYYRLTKAGQRQLLRAQEDWHRYAEAVIKVFDAPGIGT